MLEDGTDDTILVVDDDDAIRTMVQRVLQRERFRVDVARDGFEAIEMLSKHEYGTIILDLMMPRVDGLGVIEFLQKQRPRAKSVIVMSANIPGAADAARAGATCSVLPKPFDILQLVAQVRACATRTDAEAV